MGVCSRSEPENSKGETLEDSGGYLAVMSIDIKKNNVKPFKKKWIRTPPQTIQSLEETPRQGKNTE